MQRLYETYNACSAKNASERDPALLPICHTTQLAQIEIVLGVEGEFRRARVLTDSTEAKTMIPCTEESSGRAGSKPTNHPLCDKLQYVAGDFLEFGGEVTSGYAPSPTEPHARYLVALQNWANSKFSNGKVRAILRYVALGTVVRDLSQAGVLSVDDKGKLLKDWTGEKLDTPAIFKVLSGEQSQEDAFIRWRVEDPAVVSSGTWDDAALVESWISFYRSNQDKKGFCMVAGEVTELAIQHPSKLRNSGDKAKLISSNDTSGFTFRGKFFEADEAAGVGFEATQKAHNALRWLIGRQGYRSGSQAFVAWAIGGQSVPNPLLNTLELFGLDAEADQREPMPLDVAQEFSIRLAKTLAGYRQ
ncbi:MAG: type I-C CRISPR-associated protein Cas8c/Csd1, partial [Verrucomicrobia bacterium]|nr:type I-C CRISPR-associated protein Cas8c/Csd1 [Verrucomicrobiota bacterium]